MIKSGSQADWHLRSLEKVNLSALREQLCLKMQLVLSHNKTIYSRKGGLRVKFQRRTRTDHDDCF